MTISKVVKSIAVGMLCLSAAGVFGIGVDAYVQDGLVAVYNVSTDGSDDGDGSTSEPFATVAHALEVATASALATDSPVVVKVGPGTFPLNATLCVTNDIRLVGSGRDVTILDGQAKCRAMIVDCATAVVSGLTMTNAVSSSKGCGLWIKSNGGTVEDCRITGCKTATHNLRGGGVYMESTAAKLLRSVVDHNNIRFQGQPQEFGGGICALNGLVENCLVVNNTAQAGGGGISIGRGGNPTIRNCTIANNESKTLGGGIYPEYSARGTVVNCLFADNIATTDTTSGKPEWNLGAGSVTTIFKNCAFKGVSAVPSDSCIIVPLYPFAPGGYEPLLSSAVINAGTDDGALPECDLAGNARVQGSAPDIGCYEADVSRFACAGACDREVAFSGDPLVFSLTVFGADPEEVDVAWTITGADGAVIGTGSGLTFSGCFTAFGDIAYSVVASNRTTHAVSTDSRASVCQLAPMTNYVTSAENPSCAWPYATPETAATNILDAVDAAIDGAVVKLTSGSFPVSRRLEVTKDLKIIGEGYGSTTIRRASTTSFGVVLVNNANAELRGVTVTGGAGTEAGFGVKIGANGGTVAECRITRNFAGGYNMRGAGVSLESPSAKLLRSIVVANTNLYGGVGNNTDYGGGVYATAGLVENCLIVSNLALRGGGVCLEGAAKVRNCTVSGNKATVRGGGIYVNTTSAGTAVLNCLFADDIADNDGGDGKPEWYVENSGARAFFSHCAFKGVKAVPGDSSAVSHPFEPDSFELQLSSTAVNGGLDDGALPEVDFAGRPRVSGKAVDIGCYEADLSKFVCSPACSREQAFAGEALSFSATVFGAEESDVLATWKFYDANGALLKECVGLSFDESFRCYGELTAEVVATDTSDGRTVTERKALCSLGARTNYVAQVRPEASAWPYATPETAAGTVAEAYAASMDGGVVKLLPGEHLTDAELVVDKEVGIVGDGWETTSIRRNPSAKTNFRLVCLNNENASVTGLTLSGGRGAGNGAGVQIGASGGKLIRCRVCNSRATGYYVRGGGVCVASSKGVVSHCLIDNNDERYAEQYNNEMGGGVYASAGQVDNCLVVSNYARQGGGIAVAGAVTVRNCTFVRNVAAGPAKYETGAATGGGLSLVSAGATFVNCLFAENTDSGISTYAGAPEWAGTAAATWSHCAWSAETPRSATIGADSIYVDPLFKNPAKLNFRLGRNSPLVDVGENANYTADSVDLDGRPRIHRFGAKDGICDIGCYETAVYGLLLLVK